MVKGRNGKTKKVKKVILKVRPRRRAGDRRSNARSRATNVLAQGAGAVTKKAFGSVDSHTHAVWDAKLSQHLPLPRAVGPYTVIRSTRRININQECNIIGCFKQSHGGVGVENWNGICMISDVAATLPINDPNNAASFVLPLGGLGPAVTLVPSAISLQLMCPAPLQTAEGIIYAGLMNTMPDVGNRAETWRSYFDKFVNFQSPRLLTAGKLALRGVQIDSYPLNMSDVSDFTARYNSVDNSGFTWNDYVAEPRGWAPIMVYNPSHANLEYLITVEYRVRFDLDNPASASHTHHPVATDATWDRLMTQAAAMGNGVRDIADVVANIGEAAGKLRGAARMAAIL